MLDTMYKIAIVRLKKKINKNKPDYYERTLDCV